MIDSFQAADVTPLLVRPMPNAGRSMSSSSRTNVATGGLCVAFVLAWICPYHTYPYWSFYHDYFCVVGVVLSALIHFSQDRIPSPFVPRPVLLPAGLVVLVLVDAMTGRMPAAWDAVIPIGYLLAAAGAMILGANLVRDAVDPMERARPLVCVSMALCTAGVVSAFITFAQYFGVDDLLGDLVVVIGTNGVDAIRPYANLGQPNQLALILCWSLAATWYLFQARILRGWWATLIAVALLTSLALTQSKIAWLIAPALLGIAWWARSREELRRSSRAALVFLSLFFVTVVLVLPALAQFTGTVTESVDRRLASNGVRSVMILEGLYTSVLHPWIGVGWAGFGNAQVTVAPQFGVSEYAMHAHNLIANLAAENGWPVTLALLGAAGYWIWSRLFRMPVSKERVYVGMTLAALFVHSMVEFPLWYAYVLIPIAFLVGLVEGERPQGRSITMPRTALVLTTLVLSLAMVWVATDYRRLVQSFRALGYERIGWTYADGSIEKPAFTIFPHFYEYIAFADVRPTVGMTPAQIAHAEQVARRFGYAPVLMRLATIYALNERPDDAVRIVLAMNQLYAPRRHETYAAWKTLGAEYPEVLGKVFERLPPY